MPYGVQISDENAGICIRLPVTKVHLPFGYLHPPKMLVPGVVLWRNGFVICC